METINDRLREQPRLRTLETLSRCKGRETHEVNNQKRRGDIHFGYTFPVEGNGNSTCETIRADASALDTLSRSKGIETARNAINKRVVIVCPQGLSRSNGIETYKH